MVRSPARARWGAWARAVRPLGRESGVCPGRKGIAGVGALARLREEARVRERDGVRNRGTGAAVQPPCRGRRAGRAPGRAAASLPPSRRQGRRTCTAAGSRRSPRVLPRLRGPASVPVTLPRCAPSVAGPTPSGSGAEPRRRCRPPRRRRCSPVMPPVPPPFPFGPGAGSPCRRRGGATSRRGRLRARAGWDAAEEDRAGRGRAEEGRAGKLRCAGPGAHVTIWGGGEGGRLRQSRSRRWGTGRQKGADHPLRRRRRRRRRRRQAMRVAVGGVVAQRRARHAGRDCLALA